ncbi:MAG: DUF6502 family protein [Gammaproteobacteria bacterium]|nr:DUF6502 family protein [Gammaproteobacteria bacterium]
MHEALYAALRRLLRPLVRYLMDQGCTVAAFTDVVRMLYVEEALAHDREATDSHLSLVTGIHRKEIKRLRAMAAADPGNALPLSDNLAAQLVAAWVSSPDTREPHGPRPLPLHAASGPSIETLARAIKADVRPRAILDVLLQAGAVEPADRGRYRLLRSAFIPALPEDRLAFLGANVGDHLQAALHNLYAEKPFLERALYVDALNPKALLALRPAVTEAADEWLQRLNRQLMPFEQPTPDPDSRRVRIGFYYFEGPAQDRHESF